jgi:tRNA1(Val) A37 N6-methylase TrmN6
MNFDQVMLNPPYYEDRSAMGAPNRSKHISKFGTGPAIEDWIAAGLKRVKPNGCMTVIHLAEQLDRVVDAFGSKAGRVKIFPLWPKRQSAASRVIVSAMKGSAAPVCLLPGLVLHTDGGNYTDEANAILRKGMACSLDGA